MIKKAETVQVTEMIVIKKAEIAQVTETIEIKRTEDTQVTGTSDIRRCAAAMMITEQAMTIGRMKAGQITNRYFVPFYNFFTIFLAVFLNLNRRGYVTSPIWSH